VTAPSFSATEKPEKSKIPQRQRPGHQEKRRQKARFHSKNAVRERFEPFFSRKVTILAANRCDSLFAANRCLLTGR
jgi:hypothetical protein